MVDVLADGNGSGGTLADSFLRLLDTNGNEVAVDETQLGQINTQLGGRYPCPLGNCGQEIQFPTADEAEALKAGGAAPVTEEAPQPAPAAAPVPPNRCRSCPPRVASCSSAGCALWTVLSVLGSDTGR